MERREQLLQRYVLVLMARASQAGVEAALGRLEEARAGAELAELELRAAQAEAVAAQEERAALAALLKAQARAHAPAPPSCLGTRLTSLNTP